MGGANSSEPSRTKAEQLSLDFDAIVYNCDDELGQLSFARNSAGKESEEFKSAVTRYQECVRARTERLGRVREKCADSLESFNKCAADNGNAEACVDDLVALVACARATLESPPATTT